MSRAVSNVRTSRRFPRRWFFAAGACLVVSTAALVSPSPAHAQLTEPRAVFILGDSTIHSVSLSVHNHMLKQPDQWGVLVVLTEIRTDGSTVFLGAQISPVSDVHLGGPDGKTLTFADLLWDGDTPAILGNSAVEICTQAVRLVNGEWFEVGQMTCQILTPDTAG